MARYQAVRHVPIGNGFKAYQRPILERMRTFPISETAAATVAKLWSILTAATAATAVPNAATTTGRSVLREKAASSGMVVLA